MLHLLEWRELKRFRFLFGGEVWGGRLAPHQITEIKIKEMHFKNVDQWTHAL